MLISSIPIMMVITLMIQVRKNKSKLTDNINMVRDRFLQLELRTLFGSGLFLKINLPGRGQIALQVG